jgi:hypothetical protein
MKRIELNIGLHSKTHGILNPIAILNALTGRGFVIIHYRVAQSTCEDGQEPCLAVRVGWPNTRPLDNVIVELNRLAIDYGQDCIALTGFAGPAPYESFDPQYWITPEQDETRTERQTIKAIVESLPAPYFDAVWQACAKRYHERNTSAGSSDIRP